MNRRTFIHRTLGATAGSLLATCAGGATAKRDSLAGEVGLTTGSISKHLAPSGPKLTFLEWPKLMREELDLRVLDIMSTTLPSTEPAYLERLRAAAERAGCVITNLKLNQPGLDLAAGDEAARRHAIDTYGQSMRVAAQLGARWVRPVSGRVKGANYQRLASSYRELIAHGDSLGITVLIENVGWIKDDTDAIPDIIKEVGGGLRSQPDTGNWTDAARYEGLKKAFPFAASCDFKAFELEPDGTHRAYDLKRCFQVGWDAGFRGPWCIEHFHEDFPRCRRELALLRDQLRGWMRAARPQ